MNLERIITELVIGFIIGSLLLIGILVFLNIYVLR